MYEILKQSLKEFMDSHKDWTGWDYIHKEEQTLIVFMNGLIDNSPILQTILAKGTEKDMYELLENLGKDESLSPIIIALEKNIVNNLKRRENLQEPVSLEVVRWFRRFGWKFPKLEVELTAAAE
jgi:hypothetical protein